MHATDEIEPSASLEELPVSGEICDDESGDSHKRKSGVS